MNRRNKEKKAGFYLVEVVVSTAILFSVAGAFLAMTAANGKLLAREHSLVPVSYTHLDVYKRQTMWSVSTSAAVPVRVFFCASSESIESSVIIRVATA